jgi:hypothetical protein
MAIETDGNKLSKCLFICLSQLCVFKCRVWKMHTDNSNFIVGIFVQAKVIFLEHFELG